MYRYFKIQMYLKYKCIKIMVSSYNNIDTQLTCKT